MILTLLALDYAGKLAVTFSVIGVAIVAAIILVIILHYAGNRKKMHHDIEAVLQEYCAKDSKNLSYQRAFQPEYDYELTTETGKVYIMIVPNTKYWEIKINSPTKWQYRKDTTSEAVKFVPNVDKLMRFDPPFEFGKESRRVYIVYPSIKSLLRQINECEMEFVRPKTDINGTRIVPYTYLLEDKDFFDFNDDKRI